MGFTNFLTGAKTRYDKTIFYCDDRKVGFKHYDTGQGVLEKAYNKTEAKPTRDSEITIEYQNKSFVLPISLVHISNAIRESTEILNLEQGWDGIDAPPISEETLLNAVTLLVNYSKYILEKFQVIISAPEINPCRNGTIDLAWRTHKARFLLNVKPATNSPIVASCYGDLYNDRQPIKSNLSDEVVIEHLAFWMKNLS
jgi:hypothetical protein